MAGVAEITAMDGKTVLRCPESVAVAVKKDTMLENVGANLTGEILLQQPLMKQLMTSFSQNLQMGLQTSSHFVVLCVLLVLTQA